mmetsp:Transcript_1873/g.3284  ORF Transcript_1873/g.3284 Transcript_1873/m.3284 type:complete len:200 (+) Transcript_1873:174-773(+)
MNARHIQRMIDIVQSNAVFGSRVQMVFRTDQLRYIIGMRLTFPIGSNTAVERFLSRPHTERIQKVRLRSVVLLFGRDNISRILRMNTQRLKAKRNDPILVRHFVSPATLGQNRVPHQFHRCSIQCIPRRPQHHNIRLVRSLLGCCPLSPIHGPTTTTTVVVMVMMMISKEFAHIVNQHVEIIATEMEVIKVVDVVLMDI